MIGCNLCRSDGPAPAAVESHFKRDVASTDDRSLRVVEMNKARLRLSTLWTIAALALTFDGVPADASAQVAGGAIVQSIQVDGRSVEKVDDVRLTAPGAATPERRGLVEKDSLAPGTVIDVPERTVVKLVTSNGNEITLRPNSRTKLNAVSANGESITQILGEAWFKVTRALNFFEVSHDRFLAAVKGTEFKVTAERDEIQFVWVAGEIEVSREVRVKIAGAPQGEPVTLTEYVSAERPRLSYQLNVDEYLRDFKAYRDVEEYFRNRLDDEEKSGDQARILEALANLGTALVTIGKAQDAIAYFDRSLATRLKVYPDGFHPAIAADYGRLGVAYSDSMDARRSIEYFDQALAVLFRLYPDGVDPEIAVNYTNLGVAYAKAGDSRRAIGYFEQSLALLPRLYSGADGAYPGIVADAAMAANLGNVGAEYGKLKEPRRAIEYFEQALALHVKLYPDSLHPDVATDYNNLGVQYLQLRDYEKAADSYQRSLEILLKLYPDGVHPSIAVLYKNLASVWRVRGDPARADDYLKKQQDVEAKLKR
jgi:tetratricopeptide (TPR) repeat protein